MVTNLNCGTNIAHRIHNCLVDSFKHKCGRELHAAGDSSVEVSLGSRVEGRRSSGAAPRLNLLFLPTWFCEQSLRFQAGIFRPDRAGQRLRKSLDGLPQSVQHSTHHKSHITDQWFKRGRQIPLYSGHLLISGLMEMPDADRGDYSHPPAPTKPAQYQG